MTNGDPSTDDDRQTGLVTYSRTLLAPAELARRDRAYAALTEAVRELCDAQLRTEVDLEEVGAVAAEVRAVTARLLTSARERSFGIELGHDGGAREHGNAVLGLRNPFACAVGARAMFWDDRGARATLELGALYEGPPGCVHGGVLALVFDQLFTEAAAAVGQVGMTAELTVAYRRPIPLGTVTVDAWLEVVDGRKRRMHATCHDGDGNLTAEAEALLVLPRWLEGSDAIWPKRPPVDALDGDVSLDPSVT
ncbi:PaaI family thioesterase [Mumia zhuanghuii]|uniref:Acyl-coenzyme A thioesterase THEM4 n=2 Tax=Mumia TaxID=1546255 RepID=A0ABW1QIR9_9ACTN|nr:MULTISPECIES: PaaI family thioesterase [Mumia]KAA1423058.1 PaaI family thioesterase [Mumia zhuanghuii]